MSIAVHEYQQALIEAVRSAHRVIAELDDALKGAEQDNEELTEEVEALREELREAKEENVEKEMEKAIDAALKETNAQAEADLAAYQEDQKGCGCSGCGGGGGTTPLDFEVWGDVLHTYGPGGDGDSRYTAGSNDKGSPPQTYASPNFTKPAGLGDAPVTVHAWGSGPGGAGPNDLQAAKRLIAYLQGQVDEFSRQITLKEEQKLVLQREYKELEDKCDADEKALRTARQLINQYESVVLNFIDYIDEQDDGINFLEQMKMNAEYKELESIVRTLETNEE